MGRFASGLADAVAEALAPLFERWFAAMAERLETPLLKAQSIIPKVVLALSAVIGFVVNHPADWLAILASRIVSQMVSNDPNVQRAASIMSDGLYLALSADYQIAKVTLFLSLAVLLAFVLMPLLWKLVLRPRLEIFISFNHAREDISEKLQKHLAFSGASVFRLPFQEGATSQDILTTVTEKIRRCDGFVCLPGHTQSYVDHEVFGAKMEHKPVVFLVSENSGTLPGTSDNRYPVFRLETTAEKQFKPLIEFLSYVGADLRSTWHLCLRACRYPYMRMSTHAALSLSGACFLSLWVFCYYRTVSSGRGLVGNDPLRAAVETPAVLTHFAILVMLASIAFLSFSYSSLFCSYLIRQWQARNRARAKTAAAQFGRADWIGIIPGLRPGADMYECLFETAPSITRPN